MNIIQILQIAANLFVFLILGMMGKCYGVFCMKGEMLFLSFLSFFSLILLILLIILWLFSLFWAILSHVCRWWHCVQTCFFRFCLSVSICCQYYQYWHSHKFYYLLWQNALTNWTKMKKLFVKMEFPSTKQRLPSWICHEVTHTHSTSLF